VRALQSAEGAGVDTWEAERTLRLFEANLRRFEEHRDVLKSRKKLLPRAYRHRQARPAPIIHCESPPR
jgi:hypothetical protein